MTIPAEMTLDEKVDLLLEAVNVREFLTIEDIAKKLGLSRRQLDRDPWLLPNFGKSDVPGKIRRWHRDTWRQWSAGDFDGYKDAWMRRK